MTATTTRDPFAGLDTFADDTAAMEQRFADVIAHIDLPTERTPTCLGCGRKLTSATSIARGYGKGCWAKAHRRDRIAALASDYTARQIEDAVELVEDGGAIHLRGQVFLAVGHRGDIYRTTIHTCNCSAGLRGNRCFHSAAVRLVAGTEPTTRTAIALPGVYAVAA